VRPALVLSLFLVPVVFAQAPALSAVGIMQKVAENQDREQQGRLAFLYEEHIRVATRRTNGKLAREETTDFLITPASKGVEKKKLSVKGRYEKKGRYTDFSGDPVPESGGLDAGLVEGFRDGLFHKDSKDGLGKHLFPLTTEGQKNLKFELAGEQLVSGRKSYRIKFAPADKNEFTWAGEALIDEEEFQPVSVYTRLSRRIPFAVRTFLGTDLPGLGFNTQYARLDKDIWFPVSFGTEFRLRAVFFINRTITVSMENKNFKRASAESEIRYGDQIFQ
jgi:hypothetical protein